MSIQPPLGHWTGPSVTWIGNLISRLTLASLLTFTLADAYQLQWVFVHVPY